MVNQTFVLERNYEKTAEPQKYRGIVPGRFNETYATTQVDARRTATKWMDACRSKKLITHLFTGVLKFGGPQVRNVTFAWIVFACFGHGCRLASNTSLLFVPVYMTVGGGESAHLFDQTCASEVGLTVRDDSSRRRLLVSTVLFLPKMQLPHFFIHPNNYHRDQQHRLG
jgi:hypothetical protein